MRNKLFSLNMGKRKTPKFSFFLFWEVTRSWKNIVLETPCKPHEQPYSIKVCGDFWDTLYFKSLLQTPTVALVKHPCPLLPFFPLHQPHDRLICSNYTQLLLQSFLFLRATVWWQNSIQTISSASLLQVVVVLAFPLQLPSSNVAGRTLPLCSRGWQVWSDVVIGNSKQAIPRV